MVREKLVHGSDWPIVPLPSPTLIGMKSSLSAMGESNWIQRDIRLKREVGFDEAYWQRAGKLLRVKRSTGVSPVS